MTTFIAVLFSGALLPFFKFPFHFSDNELACQTQPRYFQKRTLFRSAHTVGFEFSWIGRQVDRLAFKSRTGVTSAGAGKTNGATIVVRCCQMYYFSEYHFYYRSGVVSCSFIPNNEGSSSICPFSKNIFKLF